MCMCVSYSILSHFHENSSSFLSLSARQSVSYAHSYYCTHSFTHTHTLQIYGRYSYCNSKTEWHTERRHTRAQNWFLFAQLSSPQSFTTVRSQHHFMQNILGFQLPEHKVLLSLLSFWFNNLKGGIWTKQEIREMTRWVLGDVDHHLGQGGYVSSCVCLLVCQQNNTKTTWQISVKLGWRTDLGPE